VEGKPVKTNLEKKDTTILTFLLLFAVAAGLLGEYLGWQIEIDSKDFWQALIPAVACLYFVYRTEKIWGGEVLRFLTVIGSGIIFHAVIWGIIVQWHISGMPSLLGLSSAALYLLLHGMSAVAFGMTAYGFYIFYQSSKEEKT